MVDIVGQFVIDKKWLVISSCLVDGQVVVPCTGYMGVISNLVGVVK